MCPIAKYRKEDAIGYTMSQEGHDTGPWGGNALDEGEDSLGQGEPMSKVVGGCTGGGKPVPQPSDDVGGVEGLSF